MIVQQEARALAGAAMINGACSAGEVPASKLESRGVQPLRWQDRAATMPRAQVDDILWCAKYLPPSDRALIEGVYRRGLSVSALAAILGQRPHRLRRRLRNIVQRMRSPLFRYVLRLLAMREASRSSRRARGNVAEAVSKRESTTERRLRVGRAIVLQRRSQRETARELNLSLHRVRREIDRLRAIAEEAAAHQN